MHSYYIYSMLYLEITRYTYDYMLYMVITDTNIC